MEKLREIIRKIILETDFKKGVEIVSEIKINKTEPLKYEEFKLDGETQYGFQTKNENVYYLSLKKVFIVTNNETVLKLYPKHINEGGRLEFVAINFFPEGKNPNSASTFSDLTNARENLSILGNIFWLLEKYTSANPSEKCFIFSADSKRMTLYSNVFKELDTEFHVLPPKKYDTNYEHKQVILIKK